MLPLLREENPALDQTLANLAELAREEEARWQTELARLLPQLLLPGKPVRGGGRAVSTAVGEQALSIEIDRLRGLDPALRRRVLRAAARQLGARLSFEETARLLALAGFGGHPTVTPRNGATLELAQGLRAERSLRELRLFRAERDLEFVWPIGHRTAPKSHPTLRTCLPCKHAESSPFGVESDLIDGMSRWSCPISSHHTQNLRPAAPSKRLANPDVRDTVGQL